MGRHRPAQTGLRSFRSISKQSTIVLLLVAVLLTSGCLGIAANETADAAQTPDVDPVDSVPEGVDAVVSVDGALGTDNATTALIDGLREMGASDYSEEIEAADAVGADQSANTEFDLPTFESAIAFTATEYDEPYGGVIVEQNETGDGLVGARDEFADFETEQYENVTVHVNESGEMTVWMAAFEDDTVAVGTERAIRDVIDTRQGDRDAFGGEIRDAYEAAGDGLVKAVVDSPMDRLDDIERAGGEREEADTDLTTGAFAATEMMTVVYDTDETVQIETQLVMNSSDQASEFADLITLAREIEVDEPYESLLDAVTVEQEDSRVTLTFEMTPAELLEQIERAATAGTGEGTSPAS